MSNINFVYILSGQFFCKEQLVPRSKILEVYPLRFVVKKFEKLDIKTLKVAQMEISISNITWNNENNENSGLAEVEDKLREIMRYSRINKHNVLVVKSEDDLQLERIQERIDQRLSNEELYEAMIR